MGGESTESNRYLKIISDSFTDSSSVANGWKTISMENLVITGQTAPSQATVTATSINVKGASSLTVLFDVTGATTGVVLSFWGGLSGFGYTKLRQVTATAGMQGFRLGNATTGSTADTTGISRIDDFYVAMALSANTGASTGVTVTLKTRVLTQPSS